MIRIFNLNIFAWLVALLLHVGLVMFFVMPSKVPIIFDHQVIEISLVSPSSLSQDNEAPAVLAKERINTEVVEHESEHILEKEEKKSQREPSIAKITTGVQDLNAKKEQSALTKPKIKKSLNNKPPHYPRRARLRNFQGTVLLNVLVGKTGVAKQVHISRSSGYTILDEAALKAVRSWQFIPASYSGAAVEEHLEVPVTFQLK